MGHLLGHQQWLYTVGYFSISRVLLYNDGHVVAGVVEYLPNSPAITQLMWDPFE
jgi:hypothetical protein